MTTDADFRLLRWDDPDSQNLIRGFRALVWPGAFGLVLVLVLGALIGWPISVSVSVALTWLAAQLCFRPRAFGGDLGKAIGAALGFWQERTERRAAQVDAVAPPPEPPSVQAFAAIAPTASPSQDPAASPGQMIDWLSLASKLIKGAPIVGGALIVILIAAFGWKFLGGPISTAWEWAFGGRDDVAEIRVDMAETETRAAEAHADQAERAAERLDDFHQHRAAAQTEGRQARETIAAAPDLEARIAAHSAYVSGVRASDRAARDAALSDLDSSLNP